MTVCPKLGVILESKVVQKLSFEKKVFNEYWSPRLIYLDNIFFLKKFNQFLTSKIDFESTILALFDKPWFIVGWFLKKTFFEHVDSWAKILHFRTHHIYNSTTELTLNCSLSKSCQETLSRVFTIESLSEIPVLEEFFCNPLDINFEYFTGDFEKIAKRKEFRHGRTMWLWPRTEILKPIMKSKGLNIEGDDYSSNFRGYKWVTEAK